MGTKAAKAKADNKTHAIPRIELIRWTSPKKHTVSWRGDRTVWIRKCHKIDWEPLGPATTQEEAEKLLPRRLGPWQITGWTWNGYHHDKLRFTKARTLKTDLVAEYWDGLIEIGGMMLGTTSETEDEIRLEKARRVEIYRTRDDAKLPLDLGIGLHARPTHEAPDQAFATMGQNNDDHAAVSVSDGAAFAATEHDPDDDD